MNKTEIITPDGTMDTTLEMLANRGIRLGPIERDILRSNLNANVADLRAENARLREALKTIAEYLEQEGNSARRLNQDQNDKWEKWLKSRKGRQPYTTPGMDYAAEVMLSVSKQARAVLAQRRA